MSPQPSRRQAWINYAALGTIASIVFALFHAYRDIDSDRVAMLSRIATLDAEIVALRDIEEQRHIGVSNQIADLNKRVDIHRSDIAAIQLQINGRGR